MIDYYYQMKAFRLRQIDHDRDLHLLAWLNQLAKSTEKIGNRHVSKYPRFIDFYDHAKQERQLLGITTEKEKRLTKINEIMIKINERGIK